ncbi:MAG: hypothetical protein H0U70_13275 [Tatlockia sp.]|nr:hypothetical protein [Tatlockia sp.]
MLYYLYNFLIKCLDLIKDFDYPCYDVIEDFDEISWGKLYELHAHIQNHLNGSTQLDKNALENPKDYLTMYSAFDVDEKHLDQLLELVNHHWSSKHFNETVFFNTEIMSITYISALISATAFGKTNNFITVTKSNKCDEWDFKLAAIVAAYRGQTKILQFLGISNILSKIVDDYSKSSILVAAIKGEHPEIFAMLLEANPPERLFWEAYVWAGENNVWNTKQHSPYITAINQGTEKSLLCAKMIENRESAIWDRFHMAITTHDLSALNLLFDTFKDKNVFFFQVIHGSHLGGSVLKTHNTLVSALRIKNVEAFSLLLNLLISTSNSELIINTLGDLLSQFKSEPVDEVHKLAYEQCLSLFNKYIAAHKGTIKLTISAWTNYEILKQCYSIISSNQIKITELILIGSCDGESPNTNDPLRLISALLKNTSLLQCNLHFPPTYPRSKFEPCRIQLLDLYALILQRNNEIAAFKSAIYQDNIYNRYVKSINNCLEQITIHKEACFPDFDLEKISSFENKKMYSLKECAGFALFSKSIKKEGTEEEIKKEEIVKNIHEMIRADDIDIVHDLAEIAKQEKRAEELPKLR